MTVLLLDAHSHLHPGFRFGAYLDGARTSLAHIASARQASTWQGCLWVFETASSEVQNRLERARGADEIGSSGWRLVPTDEPVSWIAKHEDGGRLLMILGRQLPTEDGFEVLQVGALHRSSPGPPFDLRSQVSLVRERGAYPVVPWGFGKWTFRRKETLLRCLEVWKPGGVALADSALRPQGVPTQPVLSAARKRGFTVLAGTDPLPFPSHARCSGRYCAAINVDLSTNRPWSELRTALHDATPALVGRRDGLVRSLWDQARLRFSRR